MGTRKPVIALLYDFDQTLCTKNMQEYTFIPRLGIQPAEFWQEAEKLAREQAMDSILAYMYLMIRRAAAAGMPVRRADFVRLGAQIDLFPGVPEWFERMNAFGQAQGVSIRHYIISSGLKEIIEGTPIRRKFDRIYACEFHYDVNGVADWPAVAMNYTAKTQFLFRINKGALDLADNETVNDFVPEDDRPVPFRNMIYFGDGFTDVPCMKLVKVNGGQSIAVYTQKKKVEKLLRDERVNYLAPADYSAGGELDLLVRDIITQMAITDKLARVASRQRKAAGKLRAE